MATQSDPATFRANATARYQKNRARLIRVVIIAGGVGSLLGAVIGLAIGSSKANAEPPPGGSGLWFA